jgi:hypothetical protein
MGILNVTPDSLSGDGQFGSAAVEAAERLVAGGVDVLDIGAESTRPNAMAPAFTCSACMRWAGMSACSSSSALDAPDLLATTFALRSRRSAWLNGASRHPMRCTPQKKSWRA